MNGKFKIALSMGHTPTNPGATRGKITEYGLSSAIIGDLAFRLDKAGHEPWIIGADSNRDQIEDINALKPDFGLELHFNSHTSKKLNGTEVLHSGSMNGSRLAENLQHNLVRILATRDKGIVKGHYQLNKRRPIIEIIRKTNCPFVVVEPLFLSNDSDFEKIDITLISVGIMRGCVSYWESI